MDKLADGDHQSFDPLARLLKPRLGFDLGIEQHFHQVGHLSMFLFEVGHARAQSFFSSAITALLPGPLSITPS